MMAAGAIVFFAGEGFVDELMPLDAIMDHAVDGAPVGEASEVAVVDEEVDLELATEVVVVSKGLLGIVAIDGIELNAALTTPIDGLVEELAFADRPQDELVTLGNEHAEGLNGEGDLGADLGVMVFDDCSVEINCNEHNYFLMESSFLLL